MVLLCDDSKLQRPLRARVPQLNASLSMVRNVGVGKMFLAVGVVT